MLTHEDHVSPFAGYDIAAWLADLARRRGEHAFLIFAPFDQPARRMTYAQFADAVARVAGGLAARGVKPGDSVMVHLENCPETLIARFACAWLGAVCVGTNAQAAGPELDWFASSTGAVGAITHPRFAAMVSENCRGLKWIAVTEDDAGTPASALALVGASVEQLTLSAAPLEADALTGACSVALALGGEVTLAPRAGGGSGAVTTMRLPVG